MRRKANAVLTLIFTLVMVFSSFIAVNATDSSGSTDISDEAVDSITINDGSSSSVNAYVDFSVTVNFSEDESDGTQKSDVDIQSGDQIFVSWDAPEGVSFTGYSETITLYQDGDSSKTALGTAVVTTDGVTITFNDNVNDMQHVNGSVTFTIRNYGNTTSETGDDGTITSGDVSQTVTINHAANTDIGAFGAKGGAYYTSGENKIDWWLWINAEELSDLTGDIVITDTLPDTESDPTFTAFALRNGGLWNWGVYTLDNFNSLVGSFEYDETTRTVTITISKEFVEERLNGTAAVLHFSTTSTAEAGSKVSNTAYWYYNENNSTTPYEESHTGTATVPSTTGSVSGLPKGTIQVSKVVNGTTDPIEGITFRVYKVNSSSDHSRVSGWYNGEDYAEITTDEEGLASIADLTDGYYELVEVTDDLPNWIATSDITSVYVELSGTAGTSVTVPNSVKTGDITATKNWTLHDGTTADTTDHPTVYFKLYRSANGGEAEAVDGADIKAVETASGESSAEVTWSDLPLYDNSGNEYTYSVKEVDADGNDYTPDGYIKAEDGLTVTNASTSVTTKEESNGSTYESSSTEGSADSGTTTDADTVKTGDTSGLGIWVALLGLSAAAVAVIGYRKYRHDHI
jgi:hypothetical protein